MSRAARVVIVLLYWGTALFGQTPVATRSIIVRGRPQEVHCHLAQRSPRLGQILFAPGDGGWHGFAITIAENLASAGYDVYGLDTRRYLQSFTGNGTLTTAEIAADFRQLGESVRQGNRDRILLVGWSEGAGLALAAAADQANQDLFQGLEAIGMTEDNILSLRWTDVMAQITKKVPKEPTFKSMDFVEKIAPRPLVMISSTHDEYISVDAARQLFNRAREPKRLIVIDADDHKFGGKTGEFFHALNDNLQWIQQQNR